MNTRAQPDSRPQTLLLDDTHTLAEIAERYDVSLQMLDRANPDMQLSVRRLQPGQTLVIPPAPMSATRELPVAGADAAAVGFDPSSGAASTTVGLRSELGGLARSWEWNPEQGSVKHAVEGAAPLAALPRLGNAEAKGGADGSVEQGVRQSPDGDWQVKLSAEVAATATVEERAGGLAVEAGARAGSRVEYALSLPGAGLDREAAEAAARQVDPFNPSTLPVGGTVTLNGQDFSETSLQAAFTRAGAGIGLMTRSTLLEAEGTSYAITRTGPDAVQVLVGPNRAIEAYNGIGITSDVATAMLGRQDALGGSELQTARFDISTPDGQAAFDRFLRSGEVAPDAPGVSDLTRIERVDFSSSARLDLGLGPEELRLQARLAGPENTGSGVRTTYEDGSSSLVSNLQYGGGVPLRVERRFDAGGNELGHLRSYQFEIDTARPEYGWFERFLGRNGESESRNMAMHLNAAVTGDLAAAGGPVNAGDKVTLAFDEAQMTALREATRAADHSGTWDWLDQRQADGKPVDNLEFAIATARRLDSDPYRFSETLYHLADAADGQRADGALAALDLRVLDAHGRVVHAPARAAPEAEAAVAAPARADGGAAEVVERLRAGMQDGAPGFRLALDDIRDTAFGCGFQQRVDAALQAQRAQEAVREAAQAPVREPAHEALVRE